MDSFPDDISEIKHKFLIFQLILDSDAIPIFAVTSINYT